MHDDFPILADKTGRVAIDIPRLARHLCQFTRLAGAQHRAIQCPDFLDATQNTGQLDTVILRDAPLPAAFIFFGDLIKPL